MFIHYQGNGSSCFLPLHLLAYPSSTVSFGRLHTEPLRSRIEENVENNGAPVTQAQLDAALKTQTEHLVESMRDMQTEILRGFAAHVDGLTLRLRKIEADHSKFGRG